MKKKCYYWYNCIAALLLSVLGFSSCGTAHKVSADKNMYKPVDGGVRLLYGTPTRDYRIVDNKENVEVKKHDVTAEKDKKERQNAEEGSKQ